MKAYTYRRQRLDMNKCSLEGHDLKYTGEEITYSKDIKRTRFGIPYNIEHWPTKCSRCNKEIMLNFKVK
jgi:hypothetical protein